MSSRQSSRSRHPSPALQQAAAPPGAERVVGVRKTPSGPGQQYEIKWHGEEETTWVAASRVRRQWPDLVQAFEQQQQQPPEPASVERPEGAAMQDVEAPAAAEPVVAADGSSMRAQMEAMQRLLRSQAQQLQQLRQPAPVAPSQPAPQPSPQRAASADSPRDRFARKEPRAQDLSEYDGAEGTKLDTWLADLDTAIELYELSAGEARKFAVARLRGPARQWWQTLSAEAKAALPDAAALGKALRARFQPVTATKVARQQMKALQQGSRRINDYIAEFLRLRALLPDMSEADALFAFESGLRPELADKLNTQDITTLQEAMNFCARVGGRMQASSGAAAHAARPAAVHQMDMNNDGSSLDERLERIERTMLNAIQGSGSAGVGAKTQTQRGYEQKAAQPAKRGGRNVGRGPGRGGRFGGGGYRQPPPTIPGVSAETVQQRLAAGQCMRCGDSGHRAVECPSAPKPGN